MTIEWLGHSCFKIKTSTVTIITDPYDSYIGQQMPRVKADIVTVSHAHKDHSAVENIKGEPLVLNKLGQLTIKDIHIRNIKSYHDDRKGALRGENLIFIFNIDGIKVCHLGDIGEEATSQLIKEIGTVNILLIPVGGTYTIDAPQAKRYINLIEPNIVIPMHYATKSINLDIASIEDFVNLFYKEEIDYLSKGTKRFTKQDFTDNIKKVIIFNEDQ